MCEKTYEIKIVGHLGPEWSEWFDGFSVVEESGGITLLTGRVADQSALYGILKRIRDLGLPLVSINEVSPTPIPQTIPKTVL